MDFSMNVSSYSTLLLGLLLQAQVPDNFSKTFNFLQGDGVFEDGMMHILEKMRDTVWSHYDLFIADAQALAAIFMLIYFAIKSYEMMSGDKSLEIMPLLRPFGLVLLILWWSPFTRMIAYPADVIAAKTRSVFNTNQATINTLRLQRAQLMIQISDQLLTIQAQTETAKTEADTWYEKATESVTSTIKEGYAEVWNTVVELRNRLRIGFQLLLTNLLETLAIWLLRICVYVIFVVYVIYSTILIILGPFAVSVSIVPAFRDSFSTWLARFISVNLYPGVAYLVMYVSSLLQEFAMKAEISRYESLVGTSGPDMEKLTVFASNGILSFGMVIISFVIGALTMMTVPSISTWIVSTSGVSSAASAMGRGASSMSGVLNKVFKVKV